MGLTVKQQTGRQLRHMMPYKYAALVTHPLCCHRPGTFSAHLGLRASGRLQQSYFGRRTRVTDILRQPGRCCGCSSSFICFSSAIATSAPDISGYQPAVLQADSADVQRQRVQLPKSFNPLEAEARIYARWEEGGHFAPRPDAEGEPFVISMPPPNVTGKLHMGHALFVTLQDIMVRYQRMKGRPVLWLPGTDHAGIATQMVVEKQLASEGLSRQELGREAFEERVWNWREQYGGSILEQLRRLGASCDWSRERFTLDPALSSAVTEAFVRLFDSGLMYRSSYLVNWSPNLQTAVSDLEVEYSEEAGKLYTFRYPLADSEEHLPVATTRPETILGDTAVAVNPEDHRFKHFVGKECVVPLSSGRRIPIIASKEVDPEFGTGCLKITPGHDPTDYAVGQANGLAIINIMNDDGSLNANAAAYNGMDRFAARKAVWADLQNQALAIKEENYQMRVPRSQRGGEIVEPLVRDQWFVRMKPLAEPALQAVSSGTIKIVPERFEKVYTRWLENIRDWCISRQLWWGHRIPVWYCFESEAAAEASNGSSPDFVAARDEAEALQKAQQRFGPRVVLQQETDVLDTWFSSALWPFATVGWPDESAPDYRRFYPTTLMETGHDILFFWVARMIMMGLELTGKPPFTTVFLHGLVRDEKGRKMSKSLGNVVDPVKVLEKNSCDALRLTLATGTTPGQDLNLSLDRVVANRNFTNKLWNAAKFILLNLETASEAEWAALQAADFSRREDIAGLPLAEAWILSALHQAMDEISDAHERLDFGTAGRTLYNFFWDQFADWYVEAAKTRLYGQDQAAAAVTRKVLVYGMRQILSAAHPLMPFVTEELWSALPTREPLLIAAPWPSHQGAIDAVSLSHFSALQATVRGVRNSRADYCVELGRRIAATLHVQDAALRVALEREAAVVASLAKLDPQQLRFSSEKLGEGAGEGGQIQIVIAEGLEVAVPMAGLFDAEKEIARLEKQREKMEAELANAEARLRNENFTAKAPEHVVNSFREQRDNAQQKLKLIAEKAEQMQQFL